MFLIIFVIVIDIHAIYDNDNQLSSTIFILIFELNIFCKFLISKIIRSNIKHTIISSSMKMLSIRFFFFWIFRKINNDNNVKIVEWNFENKCYFCNQNFHNRRIKWIKFRFENDQKLNNFYNRYFQIFFV